MAGVGLSESGLAGVGLRGRFPKPRVSDSTRHQFKAGELWLTQQESSEIVRALAPYIFRFIISLLCARPFPFSNFLSTTEPITCSRTPSSGSICLGVWGILSAGLKRNGQKPVPCREAMKLQLAIQLACVSLLTTNALFAEEPLAISSILKVPGDYHLQMVTLEGSIQDMEPVQQYRSMGRECAFVRFRLEDKTGSIQVLAPGPCGNPGLAAPFTPGFTNGDGVRIEARIEAPGYYTGQGLPPGGNVRDTVEAVAKKVWRPGNH